MARSWFGWLTGKRDEGVERRAEVPQAAVAVQPQDIDPLTGALRWDRFLSMFDTEQEQAPGVLLVIDLGTQSESIEMIASGKEGEILPWLAQSIRQAIRSDDLLAHVTGYRFAVLLRGARQDVGNAISERILESVDNTIFMTAEGIAHLEVTIGGVAYDQSSGRDSYGEALDNLDQARSRGASVILQ